MNTFQLPDETHVSRVHLRTTDLARALEFYRRVIGFKVIERGESEASLSATGHAPALLVFTEDRNAIPRPQRATGLYHFAIRFPTRRDLAHALRRIVAVEYHITGASDHVIGESIHLNDPDGNGVELYYDRPRSQWPMRNGQIQMIMEQLDFDSLLATTNGSAIPANPPTQTDIGHINLHVPNLADAEKFFHDFLGLEVMARIGRSGTFLAAGGYHHHIAVNIWGRKTPAPQDSVGLISYRLAVSSAETLADVKERAKAFGCETRITGDILQIRDPNGCWLELEVEPAARDGAHEHGPGAFPTLSPRRAASDPAIFQAKPKPKPNHIAETGKMNTKTIIRPKLQHFGITTANLDAMLDWYGKVLEMTVNHRATVPPEERNRRPFSAAVFASNDEVSHRIAFFEVPGLADGPDRLRHAGVQHVAFEYGTLDDLLGTYFRLKAMGILPVRVADQGSQTAFYYADPDRNNIELSVNNYGDDWAAAEHVRNAPPFEERPVQVNPEKLVAAREAGASPWELHERAFAGEFAPVSGNGPRAHFAGHGFQAATKGRQ